MAEFPAVANKSKAVKNNAVKCFISKATFRTPVYVHIYCIAIALMVVKCGLML